MRLTVLALLLTLAGAVAVADDAPPAKPNPRPDDGKKPAAKQADNTKPDDAPKETTREERFKSIRNGYQTALIAAYRQAKDAKERAEVLKRLPAAEDYATRLAQLVLENPGDDVAFDALLLLMRYRDDPKVKKVLAAVPPAKKDAGEPARLDVLATLIQHHLDNPKLVNVVRALYEPSDANEELLREIVAKAKNAKVRGFAGDQLATLLYRRAEDPDMPADVRDKLLKEVEAQYGRLLADKELAKVVVLSSAGRDVTLGDRWPDALREVRELSIGKPLPALVGQTLDEKDARTADYRGKVLVLDVWATWCGPCRAMIPHEREMVSRMKGKPFALVSISCDAEKETLTKFLAKESMPWTHWWDGRGGELSKALRIRFYPTIYVVDAKGVIRYKNIRGEELEAAVNKLLGEIGPAKAAANVQDKN